MNPERKLDIEIFNAALEIESPAERARYLDQSCAGDAERRQRIEALLQAYQASDSIFSDKTEMEEDIATVEARALSEGPGTTIGPYKLLQKIGEGGMGVVYMAQQETPVQRKVALKIIKIGLDTRQVVARFEAERQALAMMDHPNIAQVFDGGSTESGRPYFVMELVQGVPITEFCDKNKLTTQERIELFIPVCRAIQSAHHKGIIHRDIKPCNVLVTLHHGEPMAKVIDFGVAKATNQKLTEKTLFTNFATMIGTPAYMSPEQAEMSSMDVDTRTDVYSLGVLLYELLTGTTPFDQRKLLNKGYGEMQRIIAEEEPEKPSVRISTMASDRKTTVVKNRAVAERDLVAAFKGDLDWIIMKCLEKDRRRRYDTPTELVADLRRHLVHEPVSAAAPTLAYQFHKFYQRNRSLVHAGATVSIIFILATIISVGMAVRMSQLRNEALKAQKNALTQAAIAEAVNQFLNKDLLEQADPWNEPDPDVKLRTVVDRAAKAIEGKFGDQPLVEASIRLTLSGIYRSLDDMEAAQRHGNRAREIYERELGKKHPLTLKALLGTVGDLIQGAQTDKSKADQAVTLASEVLATASHSLGKDDLITLQAMHKLAAALGESFRFKEQRSVLEEAIPLHERVLGKNSPETIELLIQLSSNCRFFCEYSRSADLAKEAVARSDALRQDHPLRYSAKERLSAVSSASGSWNESRRLAEENRDFALRVYGRQHWKTFEALDACIQADITYPGAADLAAETYKYALNHFGPKDRRTLRAQKTLALLYSRNDNRQKAEDLYLSGIETLNQHFHPRDPFRLNYLFQTGYFYSGALGPKSENQEKAESYHLEAAAVAREAYGERCWPHLQALNGLNGLYSKRGDWRRAAEVGETLLRLLREIQGNRGSWTTRIAKDLARYHLELGEREKADALIQAVLDEFAQRPPRSDDEWAAVERLIEVTQYYPNKQKPLARFDGLFTAPLETPAASSAAAYYHQVAEHWELEHQTWQALTTKTPDSPENWYNRSATAIKTLNWDDHRISAREMLRRFSGEPNDRVWDNVLRIFFLVPSDWSSEELAQAGKIYDWLRKMGETDDRPAMFRVRNRSTLALADVRRGSYAQALEHLAKAELPKQPFNDLDTLRARTVEVLAYCGLGEFEKAAEALKLSDNALSIISPYVWFFRQVVPLRLLYQEGARKIFEMGKSRFGIRHEKTTLPLEKLAQSLVGQGNMDEAGQYLTEAVNSFAQTPPHSDEEWDAVKHVVNAIKHFDEKDTYLNALTDVVKSAPRSSLGLSLATSFYRLSTNWPACHEAYQGLTREFPNDPWNWYYRSATAIAAGDEEDHIHCAREMLARFGKAATRDNIGLVLKTCFVVPHRWTPEELVQIEKLYDELESKVREGSLRLQVWERGTLALTHLRLGRYEKGLEHLKKVNPFDEDVVGLPHGLALSIAALCYAQLGQYKNAEEALALSDSAIERETADRINFDDLSRRNYLYREARQLIQARAKGGSGTAAAVGKAALPGR